MNKQPFTKVPHWLLQHIVDGTVQTGAVVIYLAIGKYVNNRSGKGAFPSVETLARDTGISERSVQRHLKALEGVGAIVRTARYVRGRQTSNLIQLVTNEPGGGDTDDTPRGDTGDTLTRSNELDAAAVPEEPSQAQAPADDTPAGEAAATEPEPERDEFLVVPCDVEEPHASHTWWTEAPPQGGYQYQRMCEGVTVEEIEQASRDIAAAAHAADIGLDEPAPGYPDGVGAAYPDQPAETMEQGVAIITETLGGQVIADSHGGNQHDPDGPRAQHHGGNRYTVADDPRVCPPFPQVVQHNLATWWGVDAQEGSLWEAAWQTADMATSRAVQGDAIFYDAETHLMSYLMRAKSEGRRPRHDLWVRFFIEDRAKHIQTLRANEERLARQDEDPAEREMRSATTLPPDWGNQMEG